MSDDWWVQLTAIVMRDGISLILLSSPHVTGPEKKEKNHYWIFLYYFIIIFLYII